MSDWIEDDLGSLASIAIGGTPARDNSRYWAEKDQRGHPWVSIADLGPRNVFSTKEQITDLGVRNSNVKRVPLGTLLMSFKLTIGRAGIAGRDLYTNEAIAAFIPEDGRIDARYLYYVLPQVARSAITDAAIKGVTLNKQKLRDLRIRFPSDLLAQQRIAEILLTVDEAIEQTEALIAKTQQIKAGLMHDLFTRGVTPDGQLRPRREEAPQHYKESPLGWIPKDWSCDFLDKLADRGSGHTPNRNIPGYWNGGVKWVSLADSSRLDQLYIEDTEFEISELGIQNSSAVLHPPGIVVLSRDAGVGKSAITTKPMAVSQHFMCWRCDERLDNYYLYYWLQFKKRMFENIAVGTTIQTIGLPYFRKLKLSSPTNSEEQKQIGEILRAADQQMFNFQSDLEKLTKMKGGLMHDLLSGCVGVGDLGLLEMEAAG